MTTKPLNRKLVAVNGALAILLAGTVFGLTQPGQAVPRPRGEYTMVSGKTTVGNRDAIFVLDGVSREIIVLRWDNNRKSLVGVGYRNLDTDSMLPAAR